MYGTFCTVAVVDEFQERLKSLLDELRVCAKRPGESLGKTVDIILDAAKKYIRGVCVYIRPVC